MIHFWNRKTRGLLLGLSALALTLAATPAQALDEVVTKRVAVVRNFAFDSGETIDELRLGYETYGRLNANADNVVLIAHFLAGDSHAAGRYAGERTKGWWDALIGPGQAIDTDKWYVVCTDLPCGMNVKDRRVVTTGPRSVNPRTGELWANDFPELTVRDIVRAQRGVMKALGVRRLKAVTGPSLGAMIAWQWAVDYPDFVEVAIPVGGTVDFTATERAGFRASMTAIKSDPAWAFGDYDRYGVEPNYGIAMALAGLSIANSGQAWLLPWLLPSLLIEARDFDANTYLRNLAMHASHDIGDHYGSLAGALGRVRARLVVVGFADDDFMTLRRLRESHEAGLKAGVRSELVELRGSHGHLSVLEDLSELKAPLRRALETP